MPTARVTAVPSMKSRSSMVGIPCVHSKKEESTVETRAVTGHLRRQRHGACSAASATRKLDGGLLALLLFGGHFFVSMLLQMMRRIGGCCRLIVASPQRGLELAKGSNRKLEFPPTRFFEELKISDVINAVGFEVFDESQKACAVEEVS